MKLCLYLDDSLSSLKINNIDLFQGKDHLWTNEFIEFAPYDIRLEENHEIELILYNQGNIYGINGYLKLMVSDFILIILIYLDVKIILVYIVDFQKKNNNDNIVYKGLYDNNVPNKDWFEFFLKFLKIN